MSGNLLLRTNVLILSEAKLKMVKNIRDIFNKPQPSLTWPQPKFRAPEARMPVRHSLAKAGGF